MVLGSPFPQAERPGTLLEAEAVVRRFGGGTSLFGRPKPVVRAVNGVSLTVARGETLGIVGESGCGKSTLARLLVGLDRPTSGAIRFKGQPLETAAHGSDRPLHARMQFVFQDPVSSLNPRKTVRRILEAPLKHLLRMGRDRRHARVEELMAQVSLRPEFLDRYPHELSGGQAQRIGIARALAAEPELILLDEPVSALDVSVQAQILKLLRRLKEQLGLAYVFISHDLAVVEHLCDRVAVMYFGEIVEEAPREVLFRDPRHPYTRILLSSVPVPGRKRPPPSAASGELPGPSEQPPGCPFEPRCYRAERRCAVEHPSLAPKESGRQVACFFADDNAPPP